MPFILLLLLVACQAGPAQAPAPPEKPLDPKDPRSVVEHAAHATRSQKSYEAEWTARLLVPGSDPLDYKGQAVFVSPGVLYSHYTASGGDEKNIVRAGNRAWVWASALGEWVTAQEMGMPGAGKGLQNPDEALALMAKAKGEARVVAPGTVELALAGADLASLMKEQAQDGSFEWAKSQATVRLTVDDQSRLKALKVTASLTSADPKVKGVVDYNADVAVKGYNGKTELVFLDEKKKPIPLTPKMQEAIQQVLKGAK